MFAGEAEGLAAPRSGHNCQPLVKQLRAHLYVHRFADLAESTIILCSSEPDSQDDPSVRKMIECCRLACELPWSSARNRSNQRADTDSLCPRGYRSQRNPGIEPGKRSALERNADRVGDEDSIPPGVLSLLRHFTDRVHVTALDY